MCKDQRYCEPDLVRVCRSAWKKLLLVKILRALKMRMNSTKEAIETNGWCPSEGKERDGSGRAHTARHSQIPKDA